MARLPRVDVSFARQGNDDEGRAYAIAPLSLDRSLVLRYEPQTA
jgi:hypothetical protein